MSLKLMGGAIALIAVTLVITLAYRHYVNLVEAKVFLTAELKKSNLANKTLTAERDKIKSDLAFSRVQSNMLNEDLARTKLQMGRVVKLFSNHNFEKLVRAKPGLITIRMKKATRKIFKEIENVTKN